MLTNFTTGVWSGFLTVHEPSPRLTLRADDGHGHLGVANEIAVGARNDLAVTVVDSPDVVILGNELTYRVILDQLRPGQGHGSGPDQPAAGGSELPFLRHLQRRLQQRREPRRVRTRQSFRRRQRAHRHRHPGRHTGVFTNFASVVRSEPDGYAPNNTALAVTTVTGPFIATTNLVFSEGNNVTNLARIPVCLSTACLLPVSVNFATSNSTAIAGEDYLATNGVLVFEPGVTSLVITVPIIGDLLDEGIETFFVNLWRQTASLRRTGATSHHGRRLSPVHGHR